jgi:hypothetical protein
VLEESPPQAEPKLVGVDSSGIRFGIDLALFEQWRSRISEEDAEGFVYYGGDLGILRFVCAFDYLTHQRRNPQRQAIVNAYAAAYELDPSSYTCRVRAFETFEHPAVQYLLEQFANAGLANAKAAATPAFSGLLQRVLKEGQSAEKLADAVKALDAGVRFMRMMQNEGKERRKRAVVVDEAPRVVDRGRTIEASPALVDGARNAPEAEPEDE